MPTQGPVAELRELAGRMGGRDGPQLGARLRAAIRAVATLESMPVAARRRLLEEIASSVPADDAKSSSLLAYMRGWLAGIDGDRAAAIELLDVAAEGGTAGLRKAAIEYLLPACIETDRIAMAWKWLAPFGEDVDAAAAAATRAELLLRVGMLRPAAVALHELEQVAGETVRFRCLHMEEMLATEQYEDAIAAAEAIAAMPAAAPADRDRAAIGWAFAALRLGRVAAAEEHLLELLARPLPADAPADHRVRARADLALSWLRRGAALAKVRELLAPDLALPYDRLGTWSLVARARLELAEGMATAAVAALRDALAARFAFALEQWRALPEVSAGVAFLQLSVRRDLLAVLCLAEVQLGDGAVDRCLGHALAADACGSMARLGDLEVADAATCRRVGVPPDGLMLWFVPAPSGSVALVVDAGGGTVVPLPPDLALRDQVRALRALVVDERQAAGRWREAIAAATAPLADWLYAPELWQRIGGVRRWTVLGRELLTGLPLEFLPFGVAGDRLVGHAIALDYVPSATLMVAVSKAPRPAAPGGCAVVAAGELDDAGMRECAGESLVVDADLLRAVAGDVDAASVTVRDRTGGAELLALAGDHRLVVVFAHGHRHRGAAGAEGATLAAYRPLGIALRDGFFGAAQLEGRALGAEIVALAACGTARAGVDRGEDAQLFGTAWLAAGARNVLATDGDLELVATQRLLRTFVCGCADGCDPAEALRRARVELAADPAFAHPSFSCLLRLDRTLAGPIALPVARGVGAWTWAGGGAVAALAVTFLLARRRAQPPASGGSSSSGGGSLGGGTTPPA